MDEIVRLIGLAALVLTWVAYVIAHIARGYKTRIASCVCAMICVLIVGVCVCVISFG